MNIIWHNNILLMAAQHQMKMVLENSLGSMCIFEASIITVTLPHIKGNLIMMLCLGSIEEDHVISKTIIMGLLTVVI